MNMEYSSPSSSGSSISSDSDNTDIWKGGMYTCLSQINTSNA